MLYMFVIGAVFRPFDWEISLTFLSEIRDNNGQEIVIQLGPFRFWIEVPLKDYNYD